jgi:hypothetical protein
MKENKIQLPINLYPKMKDFFYHPAKRKILLAGRRSGKTISAIYYIISRCLQTKGEYILFLDTAYRNINSYYLKYWKPILDKLPSQLYKYSKAPPELTLNNNIIHFKSIGGTDALYGESYDLILGNECSILLAEDGLLNDVLLPMLLDKDGDLVFIGSPVINKYQEYEDLVYEIENNIQFEKWHMQRMTTYENPYLKKEVVQELENSLDTESARTQIYAEFPNRNLLQFFYTFDKLKHVKELQFPARAILGFDFNISPMSCLVCLPDEKNKKLYIYDELMVDNSDITKFCQLIKQKWPTLSIAEVTGDTSGKNNTALQEGLNYYKVIRDQLNLNASQIRLLNKNPKHIESRVLCNSFIEKATLIIDPKCKCLINSMQRLTVDLEGIMDRKSGFDHSTDIFRYFISVYFGNFIDSKIPQPQFIKR